MSKANSKIEDHVRSLIFGKDMVTQSSIGITA